MKCQQEQHHASDYHTKLQLQLVLVLKFEAQAHFSSNNSNNVQYLNRCYSDSNLLELRLNLSFLTTSAC